jgi:hypothetical protein
MFFRPAVLTLLCSFFFLSMCWGKDHPYDTAFVAEVQRLFLDGSLPSPSKLDGHEARLTRKISELGGIIRNEERAKGERDEQKIREEIAGHKFIVALRMALADVRRLRENRRDNQRRLYWIENYIKEQGVDAEGREWVIFKDGLVEAKPKKIERLGPWAFAATGHRSLREVRGLALVQLWLDNTDIKEFDNNRLLLRERGGELERYHIISDLGHSLGGIFYELPALYLPYMVKSQNGQRLVLNYRSFHPNEIKNHLTMADARWGTRLIAALTRPAAAGPRRRRH